MAERVVVSGHGPHGVGSFEARLLSGFFERLCGLLVVRRKKRAGPVLLAPCSSVHTFGMAFDLDICCIDRCGRAQVVRRGVLPGRFVSCRDAVAVLERPAQEGPWIAPGDRIVVEPKEDLHARRNYG